MAVPTQYHHCALSRPPRRLFHARDTMTAAHRYIVRARRDANKRRRLHLLGEDIPLAEHLPPLDQRGSDQGWQQAIEKRERRERAARLEGIPLLDQPPPSRADQAAA